jgi:diguanylate cyclase (GGDEF)-like protein
MSIRSKLALAFAAVLLLVGGLALYGIRTISTTGDTVIRLYDEPLLAVNRARAAQASFNKGRAAMERALAYTPHNGLRLLRTKKIAISDDKGEPQYLLGVSEDITERKQAEAQIEHMSRHDALTDLPNGRNFTDRLAFTLDRAATMEDRFAVLCIDLDRFKEINDVFGHQVGDEVLREVSRRLRAAAEGAFVARIGGDEFALIAAEGRQPTAAAALANRLLAAAAEEIEIAGQRFRVGLSIGVAIFPVDGCDATTLVGNADAALHRAKAEGRGTIRFFERDMDVRLRERRALQRDLKSAIDRGELCVHYQPQAQAGGKVVGFEALIRWLHPSRGWVSPNAFISARRGKRPHHCDRRMGLA